MSHFYTLILVPKKEHLETELEKLLAPYNEEIEVAPYKKDCWCISNIARKEATEKTEKQFNKTFENLRDEYHAIKKEKRPDWKDHIKDWCDTEKKYTEEHPLYQKPDPLCDECKGTGKNDSTYNPDSKWDWWVIGGRWTGQLSDYDPTKDPQNIIKCDCCNGTGDRPGWVHYEKGERKFKDDWAKKCNGCNGCQGTGKHVAFSFASHDGDVCEILKVDFSDDDKIPYALVTPDGYWHEKGEMGWWGTSSNEKEEKAWKTEVRELINEHKDCMAVVVDCHI